MKVAIKSCLVAAMCFMATVVMAAPKVELSMTVEKDIVEVDEKGKKHTRRVAADEAVQGDLLFYTISFKNEGTEPATNVQLDNPISNGTTYVADSAYGQGSEILFSIDEGKTYKKPVSLTYEVTNANGKKESLKAEPEKYNAIRWVVQEIAPGKSGKAGFTVLVN